MRQFINIVFGGMFAILCGIGLAYGGAFLWQYGQKALSGMPVSSSLAAVSEAASSIISAPKDGTVISGLKRKVPIIFSAEQEEDLMKAAALSLPQGADKRITASAYLVKNLSRGDVAVEYNAEKLLPIASLTKLVTASVSKKVFEPEEKIVISKEAVETYGNTAGLKAGETLQARDLLYPLLMVSSNDSAEALAMAHGRKEFIDEMNEFVQSIGAYRTYFADPSGLSAKNVSTASDMAIIMDWIIKNDPDLVEITKLKSKTVRNHSWVNPTHFLSWSQYKGGKNGYTDEANRTAVSLFSLGKKKDLYAVVVLGSDSRDSDVMKLLNKVRD